MTAERPEVLQLGPDMRGGMRTVMKGLFASPLNQRYRLRFVATHREVGIVRLLAIFALALWRLAWWSLRGRGRVVHVHATVRGSMLRKSICVLVARALRRRTVLHVHSGPGDLIRERGRLGPLRAGLFRRAFRAADVVLAVSAASATALEEAYGATGVLVVPNAAPAAPEVPAGRGEEPLTVLYLGGFANPVKGGEVLLDALERPELDGLRVVLCGPGELPERGRELLAARPLTEWRGWLEDEEREGLMRAAAIFVLPSTSEGLPVAVLEAMAWARAIVATSVGGVPDVLGDGAEGLLVAPGDPAALAAAIARLAADGELRERLGAAARVRTRRLEAEEVVGRLDSIYAKLLA
jgi:glycosyltransferase involved in cell wall biosynthesis